VEGVTQSKNYAPFLLFRPAVCYKGWKTTAPLSNQSEQTYIFSTNQANYIAQYPIQSGRGLHALSQAQHAMVSGSDWLVNLFVFVVIDSWLADVTYFSSSSEVTSGSRFKNETY